MVRNCLHCENMTIINATTMACVYDGYAHMIINPFNKQSQDYCPFNMDENRNKSRHDGGEHGREQKEAGGTERVLVHQLRAEGDPDHAGEQPDPGAGAPEGAVLHHMQDDGEPCGDAERGGGETVQGGL